MSPAALIVDDEVSILKLFKEILAGLPVEVVTATGVEAALALARGRRFDLVVSDVYLREDEESGFRLLERLREAGAGPPVVMMSGLWSEAGRSRALALGAAALWDKPFDPIRVRREVETYIRQGVSTPSGRASLLASPPHPDRTYSGTQLPSRHRDLSAARSATEPSPRRPEDTKDARKRNI